MPAGQFERISLFLLLLSDVGHHSLPRPGSGLARLPGAGAESYFLCSGRLWFVFSAGNKTEVFLFLLLLPGLAVPPGGPAGGEVVVPDGAGGGARGPGQVAVARHGGRGGLQYQIEEE